MSSNSNEFNSNKHLKFRKNQSHTNKSISSVFYPEHSSIFMNVAHTKLIWNIIPLRIVFQLNFTWNYWKSIWFASIEHKFQVYVWLYRLWFTWNNGCGRYEPPPWLLPYPKLLNISGEKRLKRPPQACTRALPIHNINPQIHNTGNFMTIQREILYVKDIIWKKKEEVLIWILDVLLKSVFYLLISLTIWKESSRWGRFRVEIMLCKQSLQKFHSFEPLKSHVYHEKSQLPKNAYFFLSKVISLLWSWSWKVS